MGFDPAIRGGADGSSYTFSRTSSGQGNWNTGGEQTGSGSFARGITPVGVKTNRRGLPFTGRSTVAPVMAPPVPQIPIPRNAPWTKDIGTAIDYFDKDNPGGLYGSTFPARPGVSPMAPGLNRLRQLRSLDGRDYGNDQFGRSFRGSRNSGGQGGGGFGGGGGGGW